MNYKILFICTLIYEINAVELPSYEAKYSYESDEISIEGIREFSKNSNDMSLGFKARNFLASMSFESKFTMKSSLSNEIISSSILKSYFPFFCIDEMISSGFVSENVLTNFPICCFAFGPIFFLSNSNVDFTGNPNSFNSNNCSNPLSISVSTILNFSTLSCDFSKLDNDSSLLF